MNITTKSTGGFWSRLFNSKPKVVIPIQLAQWEIEWAAVGDKFPEGKSFSYLGREMIVTRQYDDRMDCDYRDEKGVLRQWFWFPRDRKFLLALNAGPTP